MWNKGTPEHYEKVFKAVQDAEAKHGRPVTRNEVIRQVEDEEIGKEMRFYLLDLWRVDRLLGDYEVHLYSARPEMQDGPDNKTGFELYSDMIVRKFPTYKLTEDVLKVIPGPDTPTVNFTNLREILLSKDLAKGDVLNWTKQELRFFDQTVDLTGNRILFASFPRTGNTMTRNFLEAVTGIYTGSDMRLFLTAA